MFTSKPKSHRLVPIVTINLEPIHPFPQRHQMEGALYLVEHRITAWTSRHPPLLPDCVFNKFLISESSSESHTCGLVLRGPQINVSFAYVLVSTPFPRTCGIVDPF